MYGRRRVKMMDPDAQKKWRQLRGISRMVPTTSIPAMNLILTNVISRPRRNQALAVLTALNLFK